MSFRALLLQDKVVLIDEQTGKVVLSGTLDLSFLEDKIWIGFTAGTGGLYQEHRIDSMQITPIQLDN